MCCGRSTTWISSCSIWSRTANKSNILASLIASKVHCILNDVNRGARGMAEQRPGGGHERDVEIMVQPSDEFRRPALHSARRVARDQTAAPLVLRQGGMLHERRRPVPAKAQTTRRSTRCLGTILLCEDATQ